MGDVTHTSKSCGEVEYITALQFELLAKLAMKRGKFSSFQKLRKQCLPNRIFLSFKWCGKFNFRKRQEYGAEYVFHNAGGNEALPLDDPNNRIAVSILARIADGQGDGLVSGDRICEDVARLLLVVAEEHRAAEVQNRNSEDQRD